MNIFSLIFYSHFINNNVIICLLTPEKEFPGSFLIGNGLGCRTPNCWLLETQSEPIQDHGNINFMTRIRHSRSVKLCTYLLASSYSVTEQLLQFISLQFYYVAVFINIIFIYDQLCSCHQCIEILNETTALEKNALKMTTNLSTSCCIFFLQLLVRHSSTAQVEVCFGARQLAPLVTRYDRRNSPRNVQ